MATFKDSLGNTYPKDPGSGLRKGDQHTAKSTHSSFVPRKSKRRKVPNNKFIRYRNLRGKPNGPGKAGNKSGRNKIR